MTTIHQDDPRIAQAIALCDASPDGMSKPEIAKAMGIGLCYAECLMRMARIKGGVMSVRVAGNSYRWMTPAGIEAMKAGAVRAETQDGVDCWPISRKFARAEDLPPPQTRAIKWIFDAGVSA